MKLGYVAAFLVVGGYLAFEVSILARSQHRLEPDYIYQRLVAAEVGVELCGDPPAEQVAGFEARVERMRERVRTKFAESGSYPDPEGVEAAIAALRRQAEMQTADTLAVDGCDSFMARRLLRRHEIEAER
jgi:hypothetical protein